MRKVFLALLLPFFLLAEEVPYLTSESDTYALIDGVVNAFNGKLVQIDQDIRTGGVDPVEMVRFYDGGHHFDSEFGYGIGCSYPALIEVMNFENPKYVRVEVRQGLEVLCEVKRRKDLETKKSGDIFSGSVSKLYYKEGYTNCPTHLLQGEPSVFALQLQLDNNQALVVLGDGTKRFYTRIPGPYYRLAMEELPSGNKRHFFYTGSFFPFALRDICTTNRDGTLNLNWLRFRETEDGVRVTASNGQEAEYTLRSKKGKVKKGNAFHNTSLKPEQDLLFRASCGHFPCTEYDSLQNTHSMQSIFSVFQVKSANRVLEVEYDKDDKVKTLKSSASALPLYTFSYHKHHTDIVDANGATKTYRFADRRPTSLVEPHRTQNFLWDEKGQLTSLTIHTPDGTKHFEQNYVYDHKGNVIETMVKGSITACGSYDTHKTEFSYDPDSNYLTSIKRNGSHECTYSYVPGTRLVASKHTYFNQHCEERETYQYDKNGILISKVVDDGPNSTYQLVTEIDPQLDPSLPGMTQPHFIKESHVDIATKQSHPLKTTECLYTQGDLIAEKRVSDAEGIHRYTLYYEYNDRRELVREINALGESTIYAYDAIGNKNYEEKVGSGKKTHFSYDLANRLIEEKEVHSDRELIKKFTYDPMGNRLTETDIYGRITYKKYDLASREILSLDPLGYTEEKNYDLFGNVTLDKDKENHLIRTAYTIFKKPLEIVYPDNSVEWFAYDLEGHLIKEWKRDESVLCHQVDYKGRVTKTEFFSKEGILQKTLQYIYKGPHLVGEIDALGNITEYRIDGAGRTLEKIQAGKTIRYSYDALGRLNKTTTGDICSTCVEYDLLDRKIEERMEDLSGTIYSKTQFEYDVLGNVTTRRSYIDESNFSEYRTVFNSQSLPILEIDPLGFEKTISYSQTDHLEKTTIDALGRRTLEVFDPLHRVHERKVFSSTDVLLSQENILHDGRNNPCLHTYQIVLNGTSIGTYEVNATFNPFNQKILEVEQGIKTTKWFYHRGRLMQLTNPDGTVISYSYDPLGHLTSEQTNSFTYDLNGNVTCAQNENGSVEREYDPLNRLIYEKQSAGHEFFYSYDSLDRITEMRFCDGSVTYTYSPTALTSCTRNNLYTYSQTCNWKGKVTSASFNEIPCTYNWDLAGRCAEINAASYHQKLTYDPVGNLILDTNDHYAYDDLNQLISEPDAHYIYDSLNNRRNETTLNLLNQITQAGNEKYAYDANGRRTLHNDSSYTYDALGHLTTFKNGPLEIHYKYDALSRRIQKTENDQTTHYLYQFDTEIGSFTDHLTEFRLIYNRFATVALELNNTIYFPIRNHRGDLMQLLDTQGVPQSTYRYNAFGNISTSDPLSPWLLSGQRYEPATNLYHFNNRDYDPHLGRWLTCDPLGSCDGPNLYAYVHNNPLIYIDPHGLFREESKDLAHGFSRGALDDTTWNASSLALGEFQPKGLCGRIGYGIGTAGSFAAGLYYGTSEAKIVKYGINLFQRMVQKTPSLSLKAMQSIKTVSRIDKAQVSPDLAKISQLIVSENKAINAANYSSANAIRLKNSLIAKEIAGGHAFEKHILTQGEFGGFIRTRDQFSKHIENILNNPTFSKQLRNNRIGYWHQETGTVVIRNSRAVDGGTAFQPGKGIIYYQETLR